MQRTSGSTKSIPELLNQGDIVTRKESRTHRKFVDRELFRNDVRITKHLDCDKMTELERQVRVRLYDRNWRMGRYLGCDDHHICESLQKNFELQEGEKAMKSEKEAEQGGKKAEEGEIAAEY